MSVGAVEYVLAQQDHRAPEGITYLLCWTPIGPAGTHELARAERFTSEREAMLHPASSFPLTFYRPCSVVGDIVGRPLDWLEAEMAATKRRLDGEDQGDGIRVFA